MGKWKMFYKLFINKNNNYSHLEIQVFQDKTGEKGKEMFEKGKDP